MTVKSKSGAWVVPDEWNGKTPRTPQHFNNRRFWKAPTVPHLAAYGPMTFDAIAVGSNDIELPTPLVIPRGIVRVQLDGSTLRFVMVDSVVTPSGWGRP